MISINIDYKKWNLYYENTSFEEGVDAIYSLIGDIPYEMLGINVKPIRSEVQSIAKSSKDFKEALGKIDFKKYSKEEYSKLIEIIIFESLFLSFYKPFILSNFKVSKPKFSKRVTLMSNTDWVVIKKLSGEDSIEEKEVASFLLNQKFSLLNKIYEKNPNYSKLEDYSKKLKGKRKNLNSLISAYELESKNPFNFIMAASVVGYTLTPDTKLLKSTFPEFKPPAMKGRKPKK